jgi:hypothetical protein
MLTPERIEQERVRFCKAITDYDRKADLSYDIYNERFFDDQVEDRYWGWLAAIEAQDKSGGAEGNFWYLSHDENELANSEDTEVLQDAVLNLYEDIRCLKEHMQAQEITLPEPLLENDLGYNSYSAGHDDGQKHYYKTAIESLEQQGLTVKV